MPEHLGFKLSVDPGRAFIKVIFSGQLDVVVLDSFEDEFRMAMTLVSTNKSGVVDCFLLVDTRAQGVQSQEVALRIQALVGSYEVKLHRVAVIVSNSLLQKMQIQRIGSAKRQAIFHTEQGAMDWLISNGLT